MKPRFSQILKKKHWYAGYMQGWPEPYTHTVYGRMYGDSPAKNTVCTPYMPMNVWFWPTLVICED